LTRLVTRTKESNLNASLRVTIKPESVMKVKGIYSLFNPILVPFKKGRSKVPLFEASKTQVQDWPL